jgi:hypothetical protein
MIGTKPFAEPNDNRDQSEIDQNAGHTEESYGGDGVIEEPEPYIESRGSQDNAEDLVHEQRPLQSQRRNRAHGRPVDEGAKQPH